MDEKKYLDQNGLKKLVSLIKNFIKEKIGVANGIAPLDGDKKIPIEYLPQYVTDVVNGYYYDNNFYKDPSHTELIKGEEKILYVDLESDLIYRYDPYEANTYVQIGGSDMVELTEEEVQSIWEEAGE